MFRLSFQALSGFWSFQTTTVPKLHPFVKGHSSALSSVPHLLYREARCARLSGEGHDQEAGPSVWESLQTRGGLGDGSWQPQDEPRTKGVNNFTEKSSKERGVLELILEGWIGFQQ